ncbi:hypothetical protein [Microlunatus antarcticus]|uniref:ElaB/YqjD/DUF883 family membrane-anchored ribosome-binding protein n=1 Tax=Microlunatus antarcticus TaxID=53388 RepID=A0A7W5JXI7_9ACTN|nr:hypothetical protein [Microlunatus antarcticus]MBB3328110.1 ElaB/YqjD/DUF883 family membrane-anchored ribosome-binding protein [Microlunatus antarcticus]
MTQVLGVLVIGMVASAVLDQVVLVLLPHTDRGVLANGVGTFTDRVALPFLSAVLGGVLGAFVSLYVTANPSLWQRVGACTALGLTLGAFVTVWRHAERALPQQLFELRQQVTDHRRWDRIRERIRTERSQIEFGRRWSHIPGRILTVAWFLLQSLPAGFVCLLYFKHFLASSELHMVVLAVAIAAVGQVSILLLVHIAWPRMRKQRLARLNKFEAELTQVESERASELERQAQEVEASEHRLVERLRQALAEAGTAADQLGPVRRAVKALLRI